MAATMKGAGVELGQGWMPQNALRSRVKNVKCRMIVRSFIQIVTTRTCSQTYALNLMVQTSNTDRYDKAWFHWFIGRKSSSKTAFESRVGAPTRRVVFTEIDEEGWGVNERWKTVKKTTRNTERQKKVHETWKREVIWTRCRRKAWYIVGEESVRKIAQQRVIQKGFQEREGKKKRWDKWRV